MLILLRAVILLLVSTAHCQLEPENIPRPNVKGFSAIQGICDPASGTIQDASYDGLDGTLKACSTKCFANSKCDGFNFFTDQQRCTLFSQTCSQTQTVDESEPRQNFYLKGQIACSMCSTGNEFYVAFMANRVAQPKNLSLEMWFTQNSPNEATVTLESDPSAGLTKKIKVPPQSPVYALVPFTWKVSDFDNAVTIEKKALKLSSATNFVLYGVNKEFFTADAFLGIPSRALGTQYVANCYWPPYYNCEFAFTPTRNDTTVTITLPKKPTQNLGKWAVSPNGTTICAVPVNGRTYTNGESFSIVVNIFEVAQIQDPCDLTGTVIEADKPLAVWSGNSRVNVGDSPSRDHQVEQLFSTDTWGTDCSAWPTPNRTPGLVDYWVITAAEDDTTILVDSNERASIIYHLNAYESVRFPASSVNEWQHFASSKKFQAVQYSSSATDNSIIGDPSMTICIPSDQFGYGYTFVTPTGVSSPYQNYLTLITAEGNQNGFILDGQPVTDVTWTKVPNSKLIGGYVKLDSSKQQFRIDHRAKGTTFEAYIYGAGNRESIGYATGACIQALGECVPSTMFLADGKDNDCDGVVDEELLDGIDNDLDGLVDEDCYDKGDLLPLPTTTERVTVTDRCPLVYIAQSCYNGQLSLSCSEGTIKIIEAHFGRLGRSGELSCNSENALDQCSGKEVRCGWIDISNTLSIQCNNKASCSLPVNQFLTYEQSCATCSLYAHTQFVCLAMAEHNFGAFSGSKDRMASSWLTTNTFGYVCANSHTYSKQADSFSAPKSDFRVDANEGWRPAECDKSSSWLQLDLGSQFAVGWYAISGCRSSDFWMVNFGISYSLDKTNWKIIRDAKGEMKLFEANSDAITVKVCTLFRYNIVARYIRIHAAEYKGGPCAHVDFGHNAAIQSCPRITLSNSNFANGGSVGLGVKANVFCSHGWATDRGEKSYSVTCGADGRWAGDFRPCGTLLHCPDIPQIEGGYAVGPSNLPGSIINYTCNSGRRLVGDFSLTCRQDGTWSAAPPLCEQL